MSSLETAQTQAFVNKFPKITDFGLLQQLQNRARFWIWPNVFTTPITAMGCRKCLPLSVLQLKSKHCLKPHCRNGVVDTFGQRYCCQVRLTVTLKGHIGFENNFNGTTFHHDFYLKMVNLRLNILLMLFSLSTKKTPSFLGLNNLMLVTTSWPELTHNLQLILVTSSQY